MTKYICVGEGVVECIGELVNVGMDFVVGEIVLNKGYRQLQ